MTDETSQIEPTVTKQFESMKADLKKASLGDFLTFKAMLTPIIIQVIFWIGIVGIVISGLSMLFTGEFLSGVGFILLGPLVWRFYCELIIVIFKINDGVQTIARQDR